MLKVLLATILLLVLFNLNQLQKIRQVIRAPRLPYCGIKGVRLSATQLIKCQPLQRMLVMLSQSFHYVANS